MPRDTCRLPTCERPATEGQFCSTEHGVVYDHLKDDVPRRSEPADFGGGESTGVQDL